MFMGVFTFISENIRNIFYHICVVTKDILDYKLFLKILKRIIVLFK